MEFKQAVQQLKAQGEAILTLGSGFNLEEARWKPDETSWSVLEVVNHLVDEEALDFRQHLDHILFTPQEPWPSIDPEGWVTEKRYNQRQLGESLENFRAERGHSLVYLEELMPPDWTASISMPWGSLSAGDMLMSWVAHDILHLRQLIELRYALTQARCQPFEVAYAGRW